MVHITKRKQLPRLQRIAIRLAAVFCALVVCGLVTTCLTGLDPIKVYATMIEGAFGSQRKVWVLLKEMSILLCISLALAPAFRMKFWNLGGEGQVLMGALATAACMIKLGDKLPNALLICVMLLAALATGAICGFAGLLLVAGTDHTITTIAGGNGFTGVMVAWLAKFNPLAMIASSFLLSFMSAGAGEISTSLALNHSFGDILTGIILFFIIGSDFFLTYKVHLQKKEVESNV